MAATQHLIFPPFHLDPEARKLWCGEELVKLRDQNFVVLHYLTERAGKFVSKEELLKEVWGKFPGERSLKQCIFQIRKALGDDAQEPRFIETIPRRGYRFLTSVQKGLTALLKPALPVLPVVGREREVQKLNAALKKARSGARQVVFVTGEPGLGKTTLVESFLAELTDDPTVWVARGQCIEQFNEGEPYLPLLDALGQLSRRTGAEEFAAFLGRYAPTWLMQLPLFIDEEKRETLQKKVQGVTQQRMLREYLETVEAFTCNEEIQPPPVFVLVLEDLQWSDYSTLDLLSALARRQYPARLLVLGTYGPQEGMVEGHPLRSVIPELRGRALCSEITISALDEAAVDAYLERRFPMSAFPTLFPQALYRLTEGNPLFLVTILDDLVSRGVLERMDGHWVLQGNVKATITNVPENLRQLLTKQIERLNAPERLILKAASMIGLAFSAAAVAAAAKVDTVEVETLCETLAQRNHFIQAESPHEWPDGTRAACYGFRHALYQYLWREHTTTNQQQQFHQRIGERLEAAYGSRSGEIASELASHFEAGKDHQRAIRYFHRAATNALRRSANREASIHLTKAIALLRKLPETPERLTQELALQTTLGPVLIAVRGWSAQETGHTYARALELGQQVGNPKQLFSALFGEWGFRVVRAEHRQAHALATQLVQIAYDLQEPALQVEAQWTAGCSLFFLGELTAALQQLNQGAALYDGTQHHALTVRYGQDPGVSCLCYSGITRWCLGYQEQALRHCQESLAIARQLAHPFSLAWVLTNVAILHLLRRDWEMVLALTRESIQLCTAQGFLVFLNSCSVFEQLALFMQGQKLNEIPRLWQRLSGYRALGHEMYVPWDHTLLAEACRTANQPEEGLAILAEAFTVLEQTEERFYEAEMYRVKGELTLQSRTSFGQVSDKSQTSQKKSATPNLQPLTPSTQAEAEAEACFLKAIEIARTQQGKSLELRATISLARLWQSQGKHNVARSMLSEIYNCFTEGLTTEDLTQARALLIELARRAPRKKALAYSEP